MAKNENSKVYIGEFGVTINKDNYYDPDAILQNPQASFMKPCLLTTIYMMCVMAGPELFLLVSFILAGLKLLQPEAEHPDYKLLDSYRFAFDVIANEVSKQLEEGNNNLPVNADMDLVGRDEAMPEDH